ncbi:FCHO1 protein, partial [Lophotis ruficrista]|nr:FCHO1 protein [Lophotis ruficrista]
RMVLCPPASCQGEKNHGFDVLYHNMKHGQISTKELADFVRERYWWGGWGGEGSPASPGLCPQRSLPTVPRAAVEESYAKAMVKLSKMATNGTQLGTFAPLWEVFRISSDKLALCHLELMRKLHDLIKEISRYGEEQGRVHKKSKEEVSGTLEAVQLLHGVAQLLPKSKESYHSKCQEYERLRKEGTSQKETDKAELKSKKAGEALRRVVEKYNAARADFEQRMLDSAVRFQEVEEAHLRHMKGLIGSYSHSIEDTHVQIGQASVHEEFKQNVENIGTEMLLRRFAESKGTGRERPGEVVGSIPVGFAPFARGCCSPSSQSPRVRRGSSALVRRWSHGARLIPLSVAGALDFEEYRLAPAENHVSSSSDSDYDEDEPRKFYVHIKPVQPREVGSSTEATVEQLKATVGNLILPPGIGVSLRAALWLRGSGRMWGQHPGDATAAPVAWHPAKPLRLTLSGSPRHGSDPAAPAGTIPLWPVLPPTRPPPWPPTARGSPPAPLPWVSRASSPSPSQLSVGPGGGLGWGGRAGRGHRMSVPSGLGPPSASAGLSRGPSPVVLGSQDALPVATAFTEYVHAYFKGRDTDSCLVKVTGELTMSFPAGIIRVFSSNVAPPVLSFRLLNASTIEQFLPNAELLYSDPSQSDPSTRDFWLNMAALTGHLQKQAEQSPAASYYNVALLKYQFSRLGAGSAPLQLCVQWDCSPAATRVSVEYNYDAGALALPVPLANVHVLLPVDEPVANLRLQPAASWVWPRPLQTLPQPRHCSPPPSPGCGRLSASWEPLCGPSKPSPVAAQFSSEGSTLSGVEVELASAGYRMSLVKKRFATGTGGGG